MAEPKPEPKKTDDVQAAFQSLVKEKVAAGLDAATAAIVARDQIAWDASDDKKRLEAEERDRLKRAAETQA